MVYIIQVKNLRYLTYVNKRACSADVLQTVGEGSLHNGQYGSGMISVEGQPGNYSRVPGAKLGASRVD